MKYYHNISLCPCCAGTQTKSIQNNTFFFWGDYSRNTYKIFLCNTCGIQFKHSEFSNTNLLDYYNEEDVIISPWQSETRYPHEEQIDQILKSLPKGANVLDVGCFTGKLLSKHKNHLSLYGVEPNRQAVDEARNLGIKIIASIIDESFLSINECFDVITLVDVFEHLPNPTQIINILTQKLNPNGKLIIVTGYADHHSFKLLESSHWYYAIEGHISFFTKKYFLKLSKNNPELKFSYYLTKHYNSTIMQTLKEFFWMFLWRVLLPNGKYTTFNISAFLKIKLLRRFKVPIILSYPKDHVFAIIQK